MPSHPKAESDGKSISGYVDDETLHVHDIDPALNAIARRMSILIEASKEGRLSERAMSLAEYKSLHRVSLKLIEIKTELKAEGKY